MNKRMKKSNNKNMSKNKKNEGEEEVDEWAGIAPLLRGYTSATDNTLYRRNILCGHGAEIIADAEPFSENGI